MKASWIVPYCWIQRRGDRAGRQRSFGRRSSNGLSVTKTMPALGTVGEAVDRQAREGHRALHARRASARCRSCAGSPPRCDRASRRRAAARSATRYCLSCAGTKPVGVWAKPRSGQRRAGRRRRTARSPPARSTRADAAARSRRGAAKKRLNGRKSQPSARFSTARQPILRRVVRLEQQRRQRRRQVSELNAEITVVIAMVSANCL